MVGAKILLVLGVCLPLLVSGCGTVQTTCAGDFSLYAGSNLDLHVIERYSGERILAILDMPFSLVADTVLVPISVMLNV